MRKALECEAVKIHIWKCGLVGELSSFVYTVPLSSCAQASAFCLSHSFNLSNAFPRWLILFFSLLSISAYVVPSYSKHESQPELH